MVNNNTGSNPGKKHRHRYCKVKECPRDFGDTDILSLSKCVRGQECLIVCNPVKKTREIGINPGKIISVFKNEPSDSNLIISLESTRYIIAKSISDKILVRLKIEDE